MGCAPPHVALVSGLEGTGLGGKEITDIMQAVASAHAPCSGRVLPKCKVMQNGCVLVGIECPDSLRIAQALSSALPGADTYYASQSPDQQLITLGRFAGTDAAGFAAWLSNSLAGQRTLLPELKCVSIQLSEEAHPFPNPQIALTGMSAGGGSVGLNAGLGPGVGLGLNLGVGLGLGGGFGGFESSYATDYAADPVAPQASFSAPPPAREPVLAAPAAAAPPMPSTPPPQRAAPTAPPSYASAIGAIKSPAGAPKGAAPGPTPMGASPPAAPPGGSFAQRAAAGVAGQPAPVSAGASQQVQSAEQLLALFQQLTAGAEGSGVICSGLSGGYALRPQNVASWSQRLQPLVGALQTTLAGVGAARFLAMLDRVANPYGTSLAADLGPRLGNKARLEIVQDPNLLADVESTPVVASSQGAPVRLVCTPVNQSVVGATGHGNTGSCVVVGTVKERGTDPASGLLRVVPIALNLEPMANVQAPVGTPYLTLTFAWLGIRGDASDVSEGAAVGATLGGSPVLAGGPGGSASVRRPGDWTCSRCQAHNFASRSACFKCKRNKGAGEGESGFSPVGSKAGSDAGGPSAGSFRAGDWICKDCRAHNFASRSVCFKCDCRKTGDEETPADASAGTGGSNPDNFRSGDWICGTCKAHNFASRDACFKCQSRPE